MVKTQFEKFHSVNHPYITPGACSHSGDKVIHIPKGMKLVLLKSPSSRNGENEGKRQTPVDRWDSGEGVNDDFQHNIIYHTREKKAPNVTLNESTKEEYVSVVLDKPVSVILDKPAEEKPMVVILQSQHQKSQKKRR